MRIAMFGRAVAALMLLALPAAAQAMTVGEFLTKVTALQKKGVMALFSPDVPALKRAAVAATAQIQADKTARRAAGKPPLYCANDKTRMGRDQMIAGLNRIPPAQRGMSLKDGFLRVIVETYPCR